jgi:hypothetical protein
MTTDRTAAPARPVALPERSHAAGQKSAPADAFSALLGAVPPRAEEAPPRRDDAPRADQPRRDDAPSHETEEPTIAPVAEAPAPTEETPSAPEMPAVPNLFALQLAGPLPPAATPAPVPAAAPTATTTPALPAFAPAQLPITGAVPATGEPVAALPQIAPATTPAPTLPVLGGLIPASALATEPAAVIMPEQPVVPTLPQPQTEAAPDTATIALPNTNTGQPQADAQPQEQPNTAAPVASAAPQAAKPAEAPAATTPAPQPVAAPSAPAAPVTPPSIERAVPLYRAVETTRTLLHVAAERGVTHARLNLKPAELGGIEVRLQSTPLGVSAQLVADNPEAARMLTQASEDLRRQLAERDVTLLSLDVSTSSEQRHDNTAGGFGAFGDDDYRPGFGSSPRGSTAEPVDAAPAAETTLVLPDGVLVDVLA